MAFRQLTEAEIEELGRTVHVSGKSLVFRLEDVGRVSVFNLNQMKELLKGLRALFPSEKLSLQGNKADIAARLVRAASLVLPRRLDSSQLPPPRPRGPRAPAPPAAPPALLAPGTWDTAGVEAAAYRLAQAPNWKIDTTLAVVPIRYSFQASPELRAMVPWSGEQLALIRANGDIRVQLRVFTCDGKEYRMRPENQLRVNHEMVTTVQAPAPRRNLAHPHWAPPGLDVTRMFLRNSTAQVPVSLYNSGQISGALVFQIVREVSVEALTAVVPDAYSEIESKYAPHGAVPRGGDGDLQELSYTVSLDDPLGLDRIEIPAQGRNCNHFQCFDLSTYITFCVGRCTWNCPVCNQPVPHEDLVRLNRFRKVLVDFPDAKLVTCHPDGSFQRHIAEAQGKYERSVTQKRKLTSQPQPGVIELIDEAPERPKETAKHRKMDIPPDAEVLLHVIFDHEPESAQDMPDSMPSYPTVYMPPSPPPALPVEHLPARQEAAAAAAPPPDDLGAAPPDDQGAAHPDDRARHDAQQEQSSSMPKGSIDDPIELG